MRMQECVHVHALTKVQEHKTKTLCSISCSTVLSNAIYTTQSSLMNWDWSNYTGRTVSDYWTETGSYFASTDEAFTQHKYYIVLSGLVCTVMQSLYFCV